MDDETAVNGDDSDFKEFDLTINDHEGDDLMRAVWAELRQLRLDMAPMLTHFANVYDESVNGKRGDLPIGYPGRDILIKNGITAVKDIPRTMGGIRRLIGMNDDVASEIAYRIGKNND